MRNEPVEAKSLAESELLRKPAPGSLQRSESRGWAAEYEALSAANENCSRNGDDFERLAIAAGLAGRDDDYLMAVEQAHHCYQASGQFVRAARAAYCAGFRLAWLGQISRANAWLARSERLIERHGGDCPERGYLLIPMAHRHLFVGENDLAWEVARNAAAIGDKFADDDLSVYARTLQARAIMWEGDTAAALSLLDEAMLATISGDLTPMFTLLVYCSVIASYHDIHALDRAQEWTAAFDRWRSAQSQSVALSGQCVIHRIEHTMLAGRWAQAAAEAAQITQYAVHFPGPSIEGMGHYLQAEIYRLRGDFIGAGQFYFEAERLGAEVQPGRALLLLSQGKTNEALAGLSQAVDADKSKRKRMLLLPALVRILLSLGDHDQARGYSDELIEIAEMVGTEMPMAIALQARGSVRITQGDPSGGLTDLCKALAIWKSIGAPYHYAVVKELVGSAKLALGDRSSAETAFACASNEFRQLGAMPDQQRITQLLSPSKTKSLLTAREMQILRLVAAGKTNRAISSDLKISVRTIDRHISNIFNKLNVPSRAAATAYAYEHQLI